VPAKVQGTGSRRPEQELLGCVARRALGPEGRSRVNRILASDLDWERVLTLASRHAMTPLLQRHLAGFDHLVPGYVRNELQRYVRCNVAAALHRMGEVVQLVEVGRSAGVTILPYKGPVLALQLYGDVAARRAGDLDLVVRSQDFPRAREILLDRGFRPREALSPAQERYLRRVYCNQVFCREDGLLVELHWQFTNGFFAFSLDVDALIDRLESLSFGVGSVPVMTREDLLTVLCVHGSKHRWDRLEWIAGVGEILRAAGSIDWDRLIARASLLGGSRMIMLGLLVAHEMLGAPLPDDVLCRARADRTIRQLSAAVIAGLFSGDERKGARGRAAQRIFQLRVLDRAGDRARLMTHVLSVSDESQDWRFLSIGKYDIPLHPGLRPFRALRKVVPCGKSGRAPGADQTTFAESPSPSSTP
jgi:hypothetical protein